MKRFLLTLIQLVAIVSNMPKIDEARLHQFERELKREFPELVQFCEHHKKMLEDIGCPRDERHVYDLQCWDCKREQKR